MISSLFFLYFLKNKQLLITHFFCQIGINVVALILENLYSLTLITLSFAYFFIHCLNYQSKSDSLIIKKSMLITFFSNNFFNLFLLFVYTILSQNSFLNFETIDWDVHSYLVSSQDVARGNLPYEFQWEDKQPVLYYLYKLLIILSSENLVIFRILNDFLIFFLAIFVYFINSEKNSFRFLRSFIFVSIMSTPWGSLEYSELYSLVFLSCAVFIIKNLKNKKSNFLASGFLFSLSSLVNIGTLIFGIAFLVVIYFKSKRELFKNSLFFGVGVAIPQIFFLILYKINGLLNIYLSTLLLIPLGYGTNNSLKISSFNAFLKSYFEFNIFLYLLLISILVNLAFIFVTQVTPTKFISGYEFSNFVFIIFSIIFFILASKGYYHHLFFFLFFISTVKINLNINSVSGVFLGLIILFIISFSVTLMPKSLDNLLNISKIESSYPLKQLSEEINGYFNGDFNILALDYTLILYYLDKPNYSYIVHPTNHYEPWITENLIALNRLEENNILELISSEPDVIICSGRSIVNGIPTKNTYFNCEISDYNKKYIKLDTSKYEDNPNLNFYKDPYKDIGVYIKKRN